MRDGWEMVKLGDVASITKGTSPALKTAPGEFPLWVTGAEPLSSADYQFDADAVCVPLVSSTGHGHASLKRVHYASGKFALSNIVAACVPKDAANLNAKYLHLYLQHFKDREIVQRMKGTANVSLSISSLKEALVSVPPLPEQRRIVDLIGAVDDAIEAVKQEAKSLDQLLNNIGLLAQSNLIDGSWPAVDLKTALGSGGIQTGPFGSALHKHDYQPEGTAVVMPKNIRDKRILFDGIARIGVDDSERLARHALRPGDIVWSRRGDVTRFAVVQEDDEPAICGTGCFIVRPDNPAVSQWLEVWMSTPYARQWLVERAVGATMANLNTSLLGSSPVPIPPGEELSILVGLLNSGHVSVIAARAHAESLRDLRSNLLTTLLSGEHEISASYDRFLKEEVAA